MDKLRFIYFVVSFFVTMASLAENVRISGRVRDNDDKPIEFATVRVANTAIGTNTDLKGMYSLSLSANDTLDVIFSCVGFKTVNHKLIRPKGELTLNVKLYPEDYNLQELK